MEGVELSDIRTLFPWQAWHLWRWAGSGGALGALGDIHFRFWRGRRGTVRHPHSLCVAGVALVALGWLWWRAWAPLGDVHLLFTWQAWHLATSTFVLRGRRGTVRHPHSLCVAGVAVAHLGAVRRHPPSFYVAGVALGDIHFRFCVVGVALGDIRLCFTCIQNVFAGSFDLASFRCLALYMCSCPTQTDVLSAVTVTSLAGGAG